MLVTDIMAKSPAIATPETPLTEIARLMVEFDCGAIPIVESREVLSPRGIITDRDIVVRIVAEGRNIMDLTARDAMTEGLATVGANMTLEDAALVMEENQVRRVPVVSEEGNIIGIVSQADIALNSPQQAAEVLAEVSEDNTPQSDYAG